MESRRECASDFPPVDRIDVQFLAKGTNALISDCMLYNVFKKFNACSFVSFISVVL